MPSNQDFYDKAPIGICILKRSRKDMSILYANDSLAKTLSREGEDLTGQTLYTAWPGKDIDGLIEGLKKTKPPEIYTACVGERDDPNAVWVKISIVSGHYQNIPCFTLWVTDISRNKKTEQDLKKAVEEADAAAELKSNFLATMSHEIRTPMQSIFGFLELIAEEKPNDKIMSMVGTARSSAAGLLEMLDDILDIAKMDADQMQLDMFEVPVRTLISGILEALSVKLQSDAVSLLSDIDDDVPFVVIGDPMRLRQVIMNLTSNAIKFTETGSVTVRINTQTKIVNAVDDGLALRFEIIDTGIGLTKEERERLFQPFVQADSSTSRKFGGTGLGLSICKKLVHLMDGDIGVDSEKGKGSTFWFEIPTERINVDDNTIAEFPDLDGISILSVEDHPKGREEIKRSLESMGAEVYSCGTYEEALSITKKRPFDVGVFDQGLPDGLGIDLIKEVTELRPFMGLIMYTVRDDMGLQHALSAIGAKYISKPASRLGLAEAVQGAIPQGIPETTNGPHKLLIAEDTESVREILSRQLEKLGVEADFALNGAEAYRKLETENYGILFSDLHMPEMDGYALVKKIRHDEKANNSESSMPVIVLTADVQMAQRNEYIKHGFDECLLKPVSLGQLKRLLIRWGLLSQTDDLETIDENASNETVKTSNAHQTLQTDEKHENSETEDQDIEGEGSNLPEAVDKNAILAQMGSLDDSTIKMMHMFIDMTRPQIEDIQKARSEENYLALKELGHSLKGGARSACCPVLGNLAADLQDEAEASRSTSLKIADAIVKEFDRVITAINNL